MVIAHCDQKLFYSRMSLLSPVNSFLDQSCPSVKFFTSSSFNFRNTSNGLPITKLGYQREKRNYFAM